MKTIKILGLTVAAAAVLCAPARLTASVVDLGEAGDYTVLGLDQTNVDLSLVTVDGNLGVGPQGKLTFMGPSVVNGTIYIDPTATIAANNGKVSGGEVTNFSLATAVNDAVSASQLAASFAPTQTLSSLSSSLTLSGNGGTTVIDINGGINLNNQNITLNGSASDKFLFNITGGMTLVGSASVVLNGVSNSNVLFNFDGTGETMNTHVGDTVLGTILAPNANGLTLDGRFNQIIAGGPNVTLMSGATVSGLTPIPEANAGWVLAPLMALFLSIYARRMFFGKADQGTALLAGI